MSVWHRTKLYFVFIFNLLYNLLYMYVYYIYNILYMYILLYYNLLKYLISIMDMAINISKAEATIYKQRQ